MTKRLSFITLLGPGILIAATGVGAGDLITASLAGSETGLALLWTAIAGGFLKWTLTEGVARWQMATGTTVLEGWVGRLGRWIQWVFVVYFLLWSLAVGGALVSACGIAGAGLFPIGSPDRSRVVWGIVHSLVGLALVRLGGFRLFEVLMATFICVMFVCVIATAVLIGPDWGAVARGLIIPRVPPGGQAWAFGVLGGVGGTLTLLSYGYWIREKARQGEEGLRMCRIDLTAGYVLTALFGVAMIIIGSRISVSGQGARVALELADQLALVLGPLGRWIFLVGFWGAVFSSLLGVWQSAPYLFADFITLRRNLPAAAYREIDLCRTPAYRWYQAGLALVPLVFLLQPVRQIQLIYAVLGAFFMPLLALTLLIMNNRSEWVGRRFTNSRAVNAVLVLTLVFFAYLAATGQGE
jgi:Mn2+/Fe2+ NRAMP family transporter